MNAISFELSGKTAIFKKPDVNSFAYFTYNNIHKPALLGLLGGIIGLNGYTKLFDDNRGLKPKSDKFNSGFPEYYEKLKDLKVSITPLATNGYFTKKIQIFNNSVGYASFEQGGNLVVREQWLENPKWQIIILDNQSSEYQKIKEFLLNKKAVYIPYLGKNDHFANVNNVQEIEMSERALLKDDKLYLNSLFIENYFLTTNSSADSKRFKFKEVSPYCLQKDFHFYEYKTLIYTKNQLIVKETYKNIYSTNEKNYFFF